MRRLATVAVVSGAMLAAAGPAYACQGGTALFKDDFSKVDRAWAKPTNFTATSFSISGGKMLVKVGEESWARITYGAKFFPEADVCVDVVLPQVDDPVDKWAGILFEGSDMTYVAAINFDGTVVIHGVNRDGWLQPLPDQEFDGVKTGANAVNRLRVTWKAPPPRGSSTPADPTVSFYVNDKLAGTIDVPPNSNRKIGVAAQTQGGTVEFRNVVVTK